MARNLVIIDDDPSVRISLALLLESLPDTQVHSFASGDLFLDEAEKLLPACLVLDLDMPGTSGLAVLERLQVSGKAVTAIILTGAGDIDMAVKAMKLGASDFLEKPCNHLRLLEAVETAFARQADHLGHETRRAQAVAKLASLSLRERDVLIGLLKGQSNKLIAHDLGISHRTVEIYRAKLLEKLAVRNIADAFRIAFLAGLYQEN
jgi:two-component system response regulator FixJ